MNNIKNVGIEIEPRNGYLNASVHNNKDHVIINWQTLDGYDNIELITSYELGRYVSPEQLYNILVNWRSKLAKDGIVRLSLINPNRLLNSISMGDIALPDLHNIVVRNNVYSIPDLVHSFKFAGYNICLISIDSIWTTIEAQNNEN